MWLEAEYALEGCETSGGLLEGVLCILGLGDILAPTVLTNATSGSGRSPVFFVRSARLTEDGNQMMGSLTHLRAGKRPFIPSR